MSTNDKEFTVEKINDACKFDENSTFYKIYKEFNMLCNQNDYYDGDESCYTNETDGISNSQEVISLLKELYSNLYRIYYLFHVTNNYYFEYTQAVVKKMGYIYLKQWLYDQIIKKELEESEIQELFQLWKQEIEQKLINKPTKPCTFYNLKKDEIKKIKKIYAFSTVLYENVQNFKTNYNNNKKYLNYFGEGLDEFINSINSCSGNTSKDDYCKEFDEFVNICKDNSSNAGISIYPGNEGYSNDGISKYLLTVDKYEDKPLYIYLKDKKMLNFLNTSKFISSQNNTTIAATSVVGSAIGLSSIFYYFYKFTPFGSTLRKGKRKNIVNIDKEEHNSLLYRSDTQQTPFKNKEYKDAITTISYVKAWEIRRNIIASDQK